MLIELSIFSIIIIAYGIFITLAIFGINKLRLKLIDSSTTFYLLTIRHINMKGTHFKEYAKGGSVKRQVVNPDL